MAKKRGIEEGNYLPQSVLQFLDVEEEQQGGPGIYGSPRDFNPLSHTGKIYQLVERTNSDSDRLRAEEEEEEELEEEVEVTDSDEDDITFDGYAFEAILKGSQRVGAFEADFPYQRGPKFIQRYWREAKGHTREHCEYSLDGFRKVLPVALSSVTPVSINWCYNYRVRIMDAMPTYTEGFKYGTKAFTERVYRSHYQVIYKSRW